MYLMFTTIIYLSHWLLLMLVDSKQCNITSIFLFSGYLSHSYWGSSFGPYIYQLSKTKCPLLHIINWGPCSTCITWGQHETRFWTLFSVSGKQLTFPYRQSTQIITQKWFGGPYQHQMFSLLQRPLCDFSRFHHLSVVLPLLLPQMK